MSAQPQHSNRLVQATSPYLLQHAHNPVDWYPWGEEALRRAKEEDRPIFLSIGYAACHWCHVMERESFESETVAAALNREFVCIKVDREERPDLDDLYMTATQLMTYSGGWPMSVFLTPDLKPFYAGTYFPPEDRWGRPGFLTLVTELAQAWHTRRSEVEQQAERVTEAVRDFTSGGSAEGTVTPRLVENAVQQAARSFDGRHGGFGSAPKFPPSMRLELLLARYRQGGDEELLRMADLTLERMARGGMYDQVAGGFHRYSVDEKWLVPHFEKMLYDNALLARVYALAHDETGAWYYGRVAREILDYVIRDMTHPEGGFYSTTDADSEGEEGKFFVWSPEEVEAALGPEDGRLFCRIYDITAGGNFEGHSIPNLLPRSLAEWAAELGTDEAALDTRLAALRRTLWERREERVHPLLDDKILTGWNGLMIRAFAEGYRVFREERYREAAERAAAFVLRELRADDRLLRTYRGGRAHLNAYLEDYSYLAVALLDLFNVTGERQWRDEGLRLIDRMDTLFWDEAGGSYFFTSHDHEALIARVKSLQDSATPSGNSTAVLALIRAAQITGDERYRDRARRVLMTTAPQMAELSPAFPNMLVAADEYLRLWPEGARIPGADAVEIEALLSHTSVTPGGSIWVALRLKIAEGYHLNGPAPSQEYLLPTRLVAELPAGFTAAREAYPPAEEVTAPDGSLLSVYAGTVLLGLEIAAAPDVEPGRHDAALLLRMQPCDDQQCYRPMEARVSLTLPVLPLPGREQYSEVFSVVRGQAA